MQQHVKILAVLNIIYGGLVVLAGMIVLAVMGGVAGFMSANLDSDARMASGVVALLGVIIPIVLVVIGAPSIIAGVGLLKYQSWARILTIVLSALHLPSVPFGTALGIYGLWVLLKPETEALFRPHPPQAWPAPTA